MTSDAEARGSAPLPGARAALTLLLLINLFNYVDRYVLAAVVGPMKKTFFENGQGLGGGVLATVVDWAQRALNVKLEDALVGLLATAFMVTYMVTAPIFARLAERHSRWIIIGVGVVLWSVASGASGLAATFVVLFLTRCFVGVGEAAYGPVAPSIISDLYPVKIRGQVLSWFYIALPVGSALGYALGGAVADSGIGRWAAPLVGGQYESWRWAFFIVVIPGIVLGALSFLRRDPSRGLADREVRSPESEVRSPGSDVRTSDPGKTGVVEQGFSPANKKQIAWRDYAVLLKTPSYVYCTFGMAAMTFAFGGIAFWMPYYLETHPGHPASLGQITTIFGAITAVAGLTSTLSGGWVADRLRGRFPGSYFFVSAIAMLVGFPVFLLALASPFPWIWVLMFVTCFCLFFNTGPTNTILANVAPPSIRAAAFALNIFIIHALGDVISPVAIGLLNDFFDHNMNKSFAVVGVMFVVAGLLWLAGSRHLKRDTELAPSRLR